jgi:hypothetical protein
MRDSGISSSNYEDRLRLDVGGEMILDTLRKRDHAIIDAVGTFIRKLDQSSKTEPVTPA